MILLNLRDQEERRREEAQSNFSFPELAAGMSPAQDQHGYPRGNPWSLPPRAG